MLPELIVRSDACAFTSKVQLLVKNINYHIKIKHLEAAWTCVLVKLNAMGLNLHKWQLFASIEAEWGDRIANVEN